MSKQRKLPAEILLPKAEPQTASAGSGGRGRRSRGNGSGTGGGGRFRAGQTLRCKVTKAEPGGYAVLVDELGPGFLPTPEILKPEQEILALFVCMYNKRALVSMRSIQPCD